MYRDFVGGGGVYGLVSVSVFGILRMCHNLLVV